MDSSGTLKSTDGGKHETVCYMEAVLFVPNILCLKGLNSCGYMINVKWCTYTPL